MRKGGKSKKGKKGGEEKRKISWPKCRDNSVKEVYKGKRDDRERDRIRNLTVTVEEREIEKKREKKEERSGEKRKKTRKEEN